MFSRRRKPVQARRKQVDTRNDGFRWRKSWNALLLLPLLAFGIYRFSEIEEVMPIQRFEVVGGFEYLDRDEIETELRHFLGQGFFSVDIHELKRRLHQRPWTASVSVRRIWPDRARITIVERQPVARWDEQHLLSDQAVVYRADSAAFRHLPRVYAAGDRAADALLRYRALDARFAEVGESLGELVIDNRGAVDIELSGGLQIKLGRDDIDRKVTRLMGIYREQILPRRAQIERLDLRYSNGFAVAWKREALIDREKASLWSNSNV